MLDGWHEGELVGSGTVIWRSRRKLAAGEIDEAEFLRGATDSAPSAGHCNTMGTASTMNSIAEGLGMSLPGCAMIPAPYRERGQMAYETGRRIVDMAYEDLRPSKILTRADLPQRDPAGHGNRRLDQRPAAPRRDGAPRGRRDDCRPTGWTSATTCRCSSTCSPRAVSLSERFHRAGGIPAVLWELLQAGKLDGAALTVTGRLWPRMSQGREASDREVILPVRRSR